MADRKVSPERLRAETPDTRTPSPLAKSSPSHRSGRDAKSDAKTPPMSASGSKQGSKGSPGGRTNGGLKELVEHVRRSSKDSAASKRGKNKAQVKVVVAPRPQPPWEAVYFQPYFH